MHYKLAALIFLAVILFWFIFHFKSSNSNTNEGIKKLFHQMARWSTASTQDKNPVVAVLHANYGVGYMMAMKDLYSDEEMERLLDVKHIRSIFDEVQRVQNKATLELGHHCLDIYPQTGLAKYGSESNTLP